MGFGQRAGNFNELGRINSIRPSSGTPMTQVESFEITSSGQPASVIHARDPIFKPGTEIVLDANATFFTPVESYDAKGVPQYSQFVVNANVGSSLLVSEYKELFPVTKPGTMSTRGSWAADTNSGAATRTPRAVSQPQTYRREGLVQISLVTSNDPDPEVAYSDEGVNWCSIGFDNFFFNSTAETATVSSSHRTFNKYLVGAGATNSAIASGTGGYSSIANSFGSGSSTYNTNGVYRSNVVPFLRKNDGTDIAPGTQYYLKTNVTFAGASVNASATLNGTISGSFGGVTFPEGYSEFTIGDDPVYKSVPDSGHYIVSVKVDGVAETISDSDRADTTNGFSKTFTDITGNKSIEAVFGYRIVSSAAGSAGGDHTVTPLGNAYYEEGTEVTYTFGSVPDSITLNTVAQTVSGTTFTFVVTANADLVATFS